MSLHLKQDKDIICDFEIYNGKDYVGMYCKNSKRVTIDGYVIGFCDKAKDVLKHLKQKEVTKLMWVWE